MAGTSADKLAKLKATKADLKAALIEKGQTPGDVFSTYPGLVRAITTGEDLSEELTAQKSLIARIMTALEEKAAPPVYTPPYAQGVAYVRSDKNYAFNPSGNVGLKYSSDSTLYFLPKIPTENMKIIAANGSEKNFSFSETYGCFAVPGDGGSIYLDGVLYCTVAMISD